MRVTLTTFLTLDGVMQAPGMPEEDETGRFDQGGWQVPYFDEATGALVAEWFAAADGFLLGRRTYQTFAAYWPQVTDENNPVAARLNGCPKYVASTTLDSLEWGNSVLIKGDVAEKVAELKRQPGNELQVHGSGVLARTLMASDLIDEYRLWIYPVVLGHGKRLFEPGVTPKALRLIDTKPLGTGALIHVYQPAGAPVYGSV